MLTHKSFLTGLTRDEIVANAVLFFLAGFETTANTLNFAMYELALNPDIQQKVRNLRFFTYCLLRT